MSNLSFLPQPKPQKPVAEIRIVLLPDSSVKVMYTGNSRIQFNGMMALATRSMDNQLIKQAAGAADSTPALLLADGELPKTAH